MRQLMLKPIVVGLGAIGFFALGTPAMAVSPLDLDQDQSLVVPVMDEETEAVEEDLRPDDVPDTMEDSEPMMEPEMEEPAGGSDADIEDEMIDKIGPGAE